MTMAAPDWYPDPSNNALQRWWTGQGWSEYTRAAPVQPAYYSGVTGPTYAPGQPMTEAEFKAQKRAISPRWRGGVFALISLIVNPFFVLSILGLVNSIQGIRWARDLEQRGIQPTGWGWNLAGIIISISAMLLSIGEIVYNIARATGAL